MKNKITDLNNHLFSQLEKLLDEDLTDEELNVPMPYQALRQILLQAMRFRLKQ